MKFLFDLNSKLKDENLEKYCQCKFPVIHVYLPFLRIRNSKERKEADNDRIGRITTYTFGVPIDIRHFPHILFYSIHTDCVSQEVTVSFQNNKMLI
jgi:hypothetical protein